jgi:hypothetical protein
MRRPAITSGRQRCFWAVDPALANVDGCHVGVDQHRDRDAAEGRAAELLGEHDRPQRVELAAAVFRRIADAEKAQLPHLTQRFARHQTLLLPGRCERLDPVVDEAPQLPPQQLVLLAEIRRGERRGGRRLVEVHDFIQILVAPARR